MRKIVTGIRDLPHPEEARSAVSPFETPPGGGSSR
jgi:hypothetical protein